MPYQAHFGLRDLPFSLTANTQYYYPSAKHTEIIDSLKFGIDRNGGIFKVVGDVGTGKTLLSRLLMRHLVDRAAVAYLVSPQQDRDLVIGAVCHEFGVEGDSQAEQLRLLTQLFIEEHSKGRNAVLVVDEAQALGVEGLEAIRLLSNLETERKKLLQIVLFGQTELDELLSRHDLRQLQQRIVFAFSTNPLSAHETGQYINHRIKCARQPGVDFPIFSAAAVKTISKASRNIPRVVNILCDKSLLAAYSDGATQVKPVHAERAIEDSPGVSNLPFFARRAGRRLAIAAALAGLVIGGAALYAVSAPISLSAGPFLGPGREAPPATSEESSTRDVPLPDTPVLSPAGDLPTRTVSAPPAVSPSPPAAARTMGGPEPDDVVPPPPKKPATP